MADVRCVQCGPVEYRTPGVLCDGCFEIACDIAEANRRRFNALISAGVGRPMANRIMIERIDGVLPS